MPTTDQNGESKPESAWPGQEWSCSVGRGDLRATAAGVAANAVILSLRPLHAAHRCRPMSVSGSSAATMTKNCSTSL